MKELLPDFDVDEITSAHKHYKKKDVEFDYISKRDYRSIKDAKLLGQISLSKKTDDESKSAFVIPSTKDPETEYRYLISKTDKPSRGPVIGYAAVYGEENTFIEIKKSLVPFILIFILLLAALLTSFFLFRPMTDPAPEGPGIADASDWDGNLPSNGDPDVQPASAESITIPGYADLYVSADKATVQLINPDTNTVNMVYTISYNDEVVYETDGAIAPGKALDADLYSVFDKTPGEYALTFQISTYDVTTNAPCNGATQSVKLTVR